MERRFISHLPYLTRFNLLLNTALFIDLTTTIFTGLMISRIALPTLGLSLGHNPAWTQLDRLTADASVFLFGLHVAVHWKWIASTFVRIVVNPIRRLGQPMADFGPARPEVK